MHNPTNRVIAILSAISNNSNGYTVSELSKLLSIPLGTIQPILKTLSNQKLLEFNHDNNKYTIGIKAYYIGLGFISKQTVLEIVRQEMQALSLESGETCQLGVLKQDKVFYLLKIEGNRSVRVVSEVGGSLPAHATALGKVLLASLTEKEFNTMYHNQKLTKLTSKTIQNLETLKTQLLAIKNEGFGFEQEESSDNLACISVPILQKNKCIAALSVTFPVFRQNREKTLELQQILLKYKNNIEKILLVHNLL